MSDLKTLKDFEVNSESWAGAMANAGRKYTIDISDLKQVLIIPWIKELNKEEGSILIENKIKNFIGGDL